MPLDDLTPIFEAAGREWNVDPTLLQAVAQQESGGTANPDIAKSPKGASGRMQLMPDTATGLGVTDTADPVQNIYGGAKYLSQMLDRYQRPDLAVAAYNAGPDRVDAYRAGKGTLPDETLAYVPGVTKHYQALMAARQSATPAAVSAPQEADPFMAALKGAGAQSSPQPAQDDPFGSALDQARKLAAPQKSAVAEAPSPDPITGILENSFAPSSAAATADLTPVAEAAGRIGQAAVQGYQQTPPLLTPRAQTALDQGPLGRWLWNPLATAAGAVPAAANALGSGVAQTITEGANAIGQPALGRDVNMLAQVAPFARVGAGMPLSGPVAPGSALSDVSPHAAALSNMQAEAVARRPSVPPVDPSAARYPAFVPPGTPTDPVTNQMIQIIRARQPAFVPPGAATDVEGVSRPVVAPPNALAARTAVPGAAPNGLQADVMQPPGSLPGPRTPASVGAAGTPTTQSNMTLVQQAAYRSVAEGQKLNEPQPVGQDLNRYVPGVEPNQAELEQSVNTSRELKALKIAAPEVSQEAKDMASANNDRRQEYFNGLAGSDVDVANAVEARSAQAKKDLQAAFGNKKPTNAAPVIQTIQDILTDPRDSENSAVQQYVKPLLARIQNADGTLKNDPERLYGIREDIARMQSKAAKAETPTLDHVNGQLQQVKDALDGVIEKGAPGYQQYLQNYSEASRPIDSMRVLQDAENKLYDTSGRMQLSRVQAMMRNIVNARASQGLNPYKSIPDETMQGLWNLRDDLRRSATADELARAQGSDSVQNALDVAKSAAKMGALGAAHAAAHAVAGVGGNVAVNRLSNVVGAINSVVGQRKLKARGLNMLRPDPSKYPPPNPLSPP